MQFQAQSKRSCKSIRSPPMVTRRESKKNRESQAIKQYAIVLVRKRAG
ncbi:hypothetical protein HMPREF9231_1135 [Gardnerella vaginalis HMP9231]|nr:hypothetical protein HMPREF9231_1135 [Gardnerella vaginalis HMP9231]